LGPADRCLPIDKAVVHAIDDGIDDPRIPSRPVPASVKWTNDKLDTSIPLLEDERVHPLKDNIAKAHRDVSEEIRKQPDGFLRRYIVMSSCEIENEKDKWIEIGGREICNVDNWDENEGQNLETVVYSLSIMKVCKPLKVEGSRAHATLGIQDKVIDVIIVSGKTHEECFKYAKDKYSGSGQRFVVVVTNNGRSSLPERCRDSIYDTKYDSSRGPHIADPSSRFYHCGYQNLIDSCFRSRSFKELNSEVSEIMGV
jgi:hypothetical protein